MEIPSGTVVADRYVIEQPLAKGGMGAVFVARDRRMEARVALKVTAAAGAAAEELRRRFAREARIGHRLGSRNRGFVRASDWGQIDVVQLYLVLDLVEGAKPLDLHTGTLEDRLARWRHAAELVQIAHEHGVIHRDLKPTNFLQAPDGAIYLTDFGLAKIAGEADPVSEDTALTRTGVGFGTPPYMPPEQLEDTKSVDQRADIYALGCMLFEALVGRLPYPGPSATKVMSAHFAVRSGKSPAPRPRLVSKAVPEALDAVCAWAIDLEADRRPGSIRSLLNRFVDASVEPTRQQSNHKQSDLLSSLGSAETTPPLVSSGRLTTQPPVIVQPGYDGRSSPADQRIPLPRRSTAAVERLKSINNALGRRGDGEVSLEGLRRAAAGGNALAMLTLGRMYADGAGVEQSDAEAARWFRKGAEAGDPECIVHLAVCYENGRGVPRDRQRAMELHRGIAPRRAEKVDVGAHFPSCGSCGRQVFAHHNRCPHCGADFDR